MVLTVGTTDILILTRRIDPEELRRLIREGFRDMTKYVADIERGVIAIGGNLHTDAEELLLQGGSRQADLWGANYYPGRGREACIEFSSLINIRPAQGNTGMEVENPSARDRLRALTFALVGDGGEL